MKVWPLRDLWKETMRKLLLLDADVAIKIISYMGLESKSISLGKTLRSAGYHGKNLYPRHFEKTFKAAVKEGKTLRIQFKKLV